MKLTHACMVALILMSGAREAFAQDASLCGEPPPVANEQLRGELAGRARLLNGYVGNPQLAGRIETSRTEIFSKYPDAEQSRSNAYFEYLVCILIVTDSAKTQDQKLEAWKEVQREFEKPIVKQYTAIIQAGKAFIDNRRFGGVDGDTSTLELRVDGRLVTTSHLDDPFGSFRLTLKEGEHTFEFVGDIDGTNGRHLDDNCQGTFVMTQSATLAPYVVIEGRADGGSFVSCALKRMD